MKRIVTYSRVSSLYQFSPLRAEADPAVLLSWVENEADLAAIHNAAKVIGKLQILLTSGYFLGFN